MRTGRVGGRGGGWIRQVRGESEESGEWRTGGQWVRRVLKMPQRRGGCVGGGGRREGGRGADERRG